MNDENLIPFNKRTEKEQRAIAKRGGEASGKARREKRTFGQLVEIALSKMSLDETTGDEMSLKAIAAARMAEKCSKGDLKAIELAAELLGERVVKADITQRNAGSFDLDSLSDEQRRVLLSIGTDLVNKKE
jgi:hypothetical protein